MGRCAVSEAAVRGKMSHAAAESLRTAAGRLRTLALGRRVESLLMRPDPQDWRGWYDAWQAASRLIARLEPRAAEKEESAHGDLSSEAVASVAEYRKRASTRWSECLGALKADEASEAARRTVDELTDAAAESMTFLEDVPLAQAIRTLTVLREDAAVCLTVIDQLGLPESTAVNRTLHRRERAIAGELQDRRLAWRMEALFGSPGCGGLGATGPFPADPLCGHAGSGRTPGSL